MVTACALIIGNEVLSGRTQDANLAFLGESLNDLGIRLMEARVIPDIPEAIVAAVNEVRARFDYVFTTGGIGPTHDDITAECVARAFGVALIRNPEAEAILVDFYGRAELNEGRLRMANTPENAVLIENPISKAPGFQIGNVFVMAGIPRVMRAMFETLRPRLKGGRPLLSLSLTVNLPESVMAPGLGTIQDQHAGVEIGSYPFQKDGRFGVRLVMRAPDSEDLAKVGGLVRALIGELDGRIEAEAGSAPD